MANLVEPVRTLEKVQCGGSQAELARFATEDSVCKPGLDRVRRQQAEETELLAAGDAWLGGRP